jgi:hypothetical protein
MLTGAFTVEVDTARFARQVAVAMVEQLDEVHFVEAVAHAVARLLGEPATDVRALTEPTAGDGDPVYEREDPETTP